jgi:putative ABC transport system permease protein
VGKEITVEGEHYRVVGVLARKGEQFGWSPDNKVVLPYGTFARQFPFRILEDGVNISVVPRRSEDLRLVVDKCVSVLRQRRKVPFNKANDFGVTTPDQLISQFKQITGGITGAMVFIAGLSLLIGGVGVMNIMLVSVTERTREIGIRLAIGARSYEVMLQFLVESIVLCVLGGILGMLLGLGGSYAVGRYIDIPFTFLPEVVVIAVLFSGCVGVAFGFFPARKAARLNPIEALRHE